MIAVDTSSLVCYFNGEEGADVEQVSAALLGGDLVLPPVVVAQILSDPALPAAVEAHLLKVAVLDVLDGLWVRAGYARRALGRLGLKAKVGDVLIAQACIDHDVALITRDRDFRHFANHCGLKLA